MIVVDHSLGDTYTDRMQRAQNVRADANRGLDAVTAASGAIPVYGAIVALAAQGLKAGLNYVDTATATPDRVLPGARDPGAEYAVVDNPLDAPSDCPPNFRPNEALSALGPEDRAAAIAAGVPGCFPTSTLTQDRRTTIAPPPPRVRTLRRGAGGQLRGLGDTRTVGQPSKSAFMRWWDSLWGGDPDDYGDPDWLKEQWAENARLAREGKLEVGPADAPLYHRSPDGTVRPAANAPRTSLPAGWARTGLEGAQLGASAPAGNWMIPVGLTLLGVGGVLGALQAWRWWQARPVARRVAAATPVATPPPPKALPAPAAATIQGARRRRRRRPKPQGFS